LSEAVTTILLLEQGNQAADHLISRLFGKFESQVLKSQVSQNPVSREPSTTARQIA
jgi:hypothetical protein